MYACIYIYRASNASTSRSFLSDVDYSNHLWQMSPRALGPTWFFDLEDMAPVVIHVNLDRMGHFMETDEFYRTLALKSRGILGPA